MASNLSRFYYATTYYNKYYAKIIKWLFNSNEYTNFTYDLSDDNKLLLCQFISHITHSELKTIIKYKEELENDQELKNHIIKATKDSAYSSEADTTCFYGRRIGWYILIRVLKPEVVIETGVEKGLGSVVIASALLKNIEEGKVGKYYGTDINPDAGYLFSGKYKSCGEILFGDSIESLNNFNQNIDLFINDSDHSEIYERNEYLAIKNKLGTNSIIVSDNAHCSPELSHFSRNEQRDYIFFKEEPINHWYPGGGIGISWLPNK
jgi:predicted O-methyltransferase YrrM